MPQTHLDLIMCILVVSLMLNFVLGQGFFALFFASKRWQRTAEYHRKAGLIYARSTGINDPVSKAAKEHLDSLYPDVVYK